MQRAWSLALAFLVVSTSLFAFTPDAEAAAVTPLTPELDRGLVGASGALAGGKMVVFGGRHNDSTYSDQIRVLDPATGTQTASVRIPVNPLAGAGVSNGRYSGTAVAVGTKVYYFGGAQLSTADINSDGQPEQLPKASRDVIEFDTTTNTARLLNDILPVGMWGMASAVANGQIYIFGGFTFDLNDLPSTGRHDTVLRFDPTKPEPSAANRGERFTLIPSRLPYAVQDAAAAFVGRRILVMGGLSDHNNDTNPCPTYTFYNSQSGKEETRQITVCHTKRIVSFDPTPGQELVVGVAGELPYRTQFTHAAVVGGKAYIPGALLPDGTASASILEIELDRASTPQVRVLTPTLPRGTFGQAVATDGSTILIAGGRWGEDNQLTREIVRFDPRPTPPWAPKSATALDVTSGVKLTWDPPTYNGDSPVTSYRIYRQLVGGEETFVKEVTTLTYEDKEIKPGNEYTWRIVAVNAVGESDLSARVSRSSGIATPGVVTSFQAFPGNNEAILRWRAPEETGGSNITGYRVLRNTQLIKTVAPDAIEYVDTSAVNGETYVYQVRAFNAKGDGALSERQIVTPAPVPPTPSGVITEVVAGAAGSEVRVSWVAPPGSVERFLVYRANRSGAVGTVVSNITDTTFVDKNVERGRTYFYSVASENVAGRSPPSGEAPASLVRKPGAPTGLVAVGLDGNIQLAWSAPSDTGDAPPGSLRYYVSRSGGGSARSSIIKTDLEGTAYVDRTITPGQEYTYTVTTLNPMASDASEPATATARVVQNKAPVAVLAALPPIVNAGDPVELDASNSADLDGTIKTYRYDFGDGTMPTSSQQATVSHQYHQNGTYIATVVVVDEQGLASAPASAQIIVGETISDKVETGLGGSKAAPGTKVPGSETPGVPGPGLLAALAAVGVALLLRRRTR